MNVKILPLILFAANAFPLPASAEPSWEKDELWGLFRFGRLQAVKATIIKNPKLINMHDPGDKMTPLHGAAPRRPVP